jgi:hypothetical protein
MEANTFCIDFARWKMSKKGYSRVVSCHECCNTLLRNLLHHFLLKFATIQFVAETTFCNDMFLIATIFPVMKYLHLCTAA